MNRQTGRVRWMRPHVEVLAAPPELKSLPREP